MKPTKFISLDIFEIVNRHAKRKVWEEGESIEASGRLSMAIEKEHRKAAVLRRNPETSKGFCSMKEPADGSRPSAASDREQCKRGYLHA
ncbi:hypothetical protein CEXT_541821 [Caerostris extrusa]|uniref:Uncharacterized protein n=1 Tax=Caerostris extrusa TaxID=172846 RepID=A0AAV4U299_CAEEX|nr:hypothetical protein CEXT_541821 [Caerostris extrusa]